MDRRQARQTAIHRGGLIIEAALNAGWWPDDLVERHGDDGVGMIVEELTKIAESMADNRRMPRSAPAAPEPPQASVLEALRQMAEQVSTAGVLSRLCFHPGGAPAVWKHPADPSGVGHWERRCERCGAWAQNRYTVPFLGPALVPEQTRSTTGSNAEQNGS